MPGHDIIVVGTSAGGVEALMTFVRGLPYDLPASVFIVLHIPAESPSLLPEILNRAGSVPASHPTDGMKIERGHIYVALPNHHLLLEPGYVRVVQGPKENRHRPAIDPLFRSAARAYATSVIGVILTGNLDDGTAGLLAIKRQGGIAVVQDPEEALYPSMSRSAIAHVAVDYISPLADIAPLVNRLAREQASKAEVPIAPQEMDTEVRIDEMDMNIESNEQPGTSSPYSCPECGGVLWEIQDGNLLRFRCRVGHAFTADTVLEEQSNVLEEALWVALKALGESAALSRRMLERARKNSHTWLIEQFEEKLKETERRIVLIQRVLRKDGGAVRPGLDENRADWVASDEPNVNLLDTGKR